MEIYLVGGAIRDEMLGRPAHERDWVVVGATPEQMIAKGYEPVGKDFPVFLHPQTKEEYALARTERKTAPGYTGFQFHTSPDITLEQDLMRRDLTVNAIARDANGNLVDPYNGTNDLNNKILRHVSPAFAEDPVRILRIARFAARYHHLGFTVANETIELMRTMVKNDEVNSLVAERVWKETSRALMETDPQVYFDVLQRCEALAQVMPEIDRAYNRIAWPQLHRAAEEQQKLPIRFALLTYSLLPEQEHEKIKNVIEQLCQRIATPKYERELATSVAQHHTTFFQAIDQDAQVLENTIKALDGLRKPERFNDWLTVCQSIYSTSQAKSEQAKNAAQFFAKIVATCKTINPKKLIDLGYNGAELGEQLRGERIKSIQTILKNWRDKQQS